MLTQRKATQNITTKITKIDDLSKCKTNEREKLTKSVNRNFALQSVDDKLQNDLLYACHIVYGRWDIEPGQFDALIARKKRYADGRWWGKWDDGLTKKLTKNIIYIVNNFQNSSNENDVIRLHFVLCCAKLFTFGKHCLRAIYQMKLA